MQEGSPGNTSTRPNKVSITSVQSPTNCPLLIPIRPRAIAPFSVKSLNLQRGKRPVQALPMIETIRPSKKHLKRTPEGICRTTTIKELMNKLSAAKSKGVAKSPVIESASPVLAHNVKNTISSQKIFLSRTRINMLLTDRGSNSCGSFAGADAGAKSCKTATDKGEGMHRKTVDTNKISGKLGKTGGRRVVCYSTVDGVGKGLHIAQLVGVRKV